MSKRYVTPNPERFRLFRLCDCTSCRGIGKVRSDPEDLRIIPSVKCPDCRGEGRVRQEIATCATPEAVGVALVTLAREGEWDECPFGLLDSTPECETCGGEGLIRPAIIGGVRDTCNGCKGTGVKPTGTWLVRPWLPSVRNVSDAGRVLANSKKTSTPTDIQEERHESV